MSPSATPRPLDSWRSTGGELLASNREQETLIGALLTLASSESGLDQREPVDLAEIARTVIRDRKNPLGVRVETKQVVATRFGGVPLRRAD